MTLNEKQFGKKPPEPEKAKKPGSREWAEEEYDASGGGLFYAKGRK